MDPLTVSVLVVSPVKVDTWFYWKPTCDRYLLHYITARTVGKTTQGTELDVGPSLPASVMTVNNRMFENSFILQKILYKIQKVVVQFMKL